MLPKWPIIFHANDRCLIIGMSDIISVLKTTTRNQTGHQLMLHKKGPKMTVAKMTGYFIIKIPKKFTGIFHQGLF